MTEHFSNIKDILGGVEFRSVRTNFAKLIENWEDIVGKKFSGKTELAEVFQKGNKQYLLIYVKSSPLVQELGFFKQNLIKKIREKFYIEISDIIIKVANTDLKNFAGFLSKETDVLEVYDERPSDAELDLIILPDNIVETIKISVQKQTALSEEQKKRMFQIIINDLKTQEWMKQKGFPVCKVCGRVMTRKNFAEENICNICKNNFSE